MPNKSLISPNGISGNAGTGGEISTPMELPIMPNDVGSAEISPSGDFEAGSHQTFVLTYTAGKFGIDDSGSIRICFRFASDQTAPQFDNPKGPNYTSIIASNNAILSFRYDPKGNVRPWDRTLYIKVARGFLREGDTIRVTFGDKSKGSPGMRLQTFCEETFEFHTLVDPIATFCYQPVPVQPFIKIVPGKPERYVAVAPTICSTGEKFSLKLKGEDKWGNPSNFCNTIFRPTASCPVRGLPKKIKLSEGNFYTEISGLSVDQPANFVINFLNERDECVCHTNPIQVATKPVRRYFWGDLHGQSEETIGTNTAEAYFKFARDLAFLDVSAHQGNDFQMTTEFWRHLDNLCKRFNVDGKFVAIPGYEWSGNTSLGGDRNVFFPSEGRTIRRSSHAMVSDRSDIDTDCDTAADLFAAFSENNEDDVLVYAHCGGRYADIELAHDGRFEKSVEVHSSWGTFEWLVHDAFRLGYRVGIVANSDGHKGRPGASYPGAGHFGAIGGLTCFLVSELSRNCILDAMRKRHHYATSGGPNGRPFISFRASLPKGGILYHDDPRHCDSEGIRVIEGIMGDIICVGKSDVEIDVNINAGIGIERVDIFNGRELTKTHRPFKNEDLGKRLKIVWEGAEYRGRFRQVVWDGTAKFTGNEIISATPINFFNQDKTLSKTSPTHLKWQALTTGNIGGFEVILDDPYSGNLEIETPLISFRLPIEEVGFEDKIFDKSGVLPRYIKIFRLPDNSLKRQFSFTEKILIKPNVDNPIFIRATLEDGTLCWTSPIYLYR